MRWHIIEGEPGCAYAVQHGYTAVVVDALRASATAAMLLDAEARTLLVVREVEEARIAKRLNPDALLYGERGGLPPEGFDFGNSPREAFHARSRDVIFTTTTGAGRLLSAWGADSVCMGSPLNGPAVIDFALARSVDVVVIPAGLAGDPEFDAQEDWAAAVAIALAADGEIGEGREMFEYWRPRINREGLPKIFAEAPHSEKLRRVGLEADIGYCAQWDITRAVPVATARAAQGVWVRNTQRPD